MEENQGNNVNTIEAFTTKKVDSVLIDYVTWASKGITQGITISVKGVVYTGELIGGAHWCDLMIEQAIESQSSPEFIQAATSYYESFKSSTYSSDEDKNLSVNFLHLKNARIVTFNNISDYSLHWRFDIGEIDGFSLGSLSKQ